MFFPSQILARGQVINRALKVVGQRGYYRLGKGGRNPSLNGPWADVVTKWPNTLPGCDCSGGVAWVLGYDRWQDDGTPDGLWFDTSQILRDARRKSGNRLFRTIPKDEPVIPTDVLVYPDQPEKGIKQGHVMLVTAVKDGFVRGCRVPGKEWWRFIEGVDVSTGRGDRAARMRGNAKLWETRGGTFVRYLHFMG